MKRKQQKKSNDHIDGKPRSFKTSIISISEILINHPEFQEEMKNQFCLDMIKKNSKLPFLKVGARVNLRVLLFMVLYHMLKVKFFDFTSYWTLPHHAFVLFEDHNIC